MKRLIFPNQTKIRPNRDTSLRQERPPYVSLPFEHASVKSWKEFQMRNLAVHMFMSNNTLEIFPAQRQTTNSKAFEPFI